MVVLESSSVLRAATEWVAREQCYRCHRPDRLCLCKHIVPVALRTGVFVLQHPRERAHPLGTLRFVELGVPRARVEVAYGDLSGNIVHPMQLPPRTALLYPSPMAPYLEDLAPEERPENLLLLDGTWSQARSLYRQNPWLQQVPHRQIRPERPSRYRVRREPRAHFVSTLEALVYALSVVEPAADLSPLLMAFERLMDDHLAQRGGGRAIRHKRPRLRRARAVPAALVDGNTRLTVVYAEPSIQGRKPQVRLPVQLCAWRPHDGARFERFALADGRPPEARHLTHMQLSAAAFEGAQGVAEAARDFADFVRGTVCVAWNGSTAELLAAAGFPLEASVSLKASYCNLRKVHAGSLEAVLAAEARRVPPAHFTGRAAQRMANAASLLDLLRQASVSGR